MLGWLKDSALTTNEIEPDEKLSRRVLASAVCRSIIIIVPADTTQPVCEPNPNLQEKKQSQSASRRRGEIEENREDCIASSETWKKNDLPAREGLRACLEVVLGRICVCR